LLIRPTVLPALLASALTSGVACAQTANPLPTVDDAWRFSVGVSAWSPATNTSTFSTNNAYVGSTQSTVVDNINNTGGFGMFNAEAHKGSWGLMADFVYWQINDGVANSTTYINRHTSIYTSEGAYTTQSMYTAAGTYTVLNMNSLYADALFGVRYVSSTTSASVTSVITSTSRGQTQQSSATGYYAAVSTSTSPIIGMKGRYRIGESAWFMPFYADIGQGLSGENLTWQTVAGFGRAFSWGDVSLTYRAMYFELGGAGGLTKYSNYGPQLGATFNF